MKNRLVSAFVAYGILIGIACFLLRGKALAAILILFLALIARTLIAEKAGWRVPDVAPPDVVPAKDPPDDVSE